MTCWLLAPGTKISLSWFALSVASTSWPAVAPCAGMLVHAVQVSPTGHDGLFPV